VRARTRPTVAHIIVKGKMLTEIVAGLIPDGVRFRRNAISVTVARLVAMLAIAISKLSSSPIGNNAFMRQNPGVRKTKIDASAYLRYTWGNMSSGIVSMVITLAKLRHKTSQYHVALVEKR